MKSEQPSTIQALTLRTLAEGGELRTPRWDDTRGGNLKRNGSIFRLIPRKSIQIMQSRRWITRKPVEYGQSVIQWHLTDVGRDLARDLVTRAPSPIASGSSSEEGL